MDIKITNEAKALQEAMKKAFDKVGPITEKELKKELSIVKRKAVENWPVRQEKYGPSEGSRKKIQTMLKKNGGNIDGAISNSAPYAWKIRAGSDSDTSVPRGKRVAEELLFRPLQEASDRISKEIARQIIGKLR